MTITIKDGPDVPVQVDGEAWMQKPGVIKIEHKAREYKLLKAWVEIFVSKECAKSNSDGVF